jgi:hypothetical protein
MLHAISPILLSLCLLCTCATLRACSESARASRRALRGSRRAPSSLGDHAPVSFRRVGQSLDLAQPTTLPSSHPVCRRPTHRGAGVVPGVQVERATVRTTWTPGAASARLCLGRRQTGWEPSAPATHGRHSRTGPSAISEPERPRRRLVLSAASLHGARPIMASVLPRCGRASASAAPSGPKAGARARPEPGARPAERSAAGA